jgi:predicted O-methyltransferase YrrM
MTIRLIRSRFLSLSLALSGRPMPMPPHMKVRAIKDAAIHIHATVFIETGTYRGDTSRILSKRVHQVVSVEIDKRLATLARERFGNSNIEILEGDRAELMSSIVSRFKNQVCLYWLDGHYSSGVTGGKVKPVPVQRELEEILPFLKSSDLIVIDDIREFDGKNYPSLDHLTSYITQIRPDLDYRTLNDMLFVGAPAAALFDF